ncbi:dihydrolipoamide acetyltransferase family protein [Arthrobacter sp. H35-D1]|uniref:dihydrolipoamide acetyltransferase family protein n=1 Tax=Arthrobacter sp. H35-D1 TaxID=3046202 RepID=UPI0024B9A229|nr:dihydrolipoamide acetyltransferase family protein [Arthrobacter sp. H35-D1]MDJ0312796.1 dihydrolipoamide acetyltransferase family protein [Arthrobacter sp. H35-D1]
MPEVIMPRLSDTMEEGILGRWLKHEGDPVKAGDVIGEIETDKATMDLEAFDDGVLERLLVAEGATVAIGQPVAFIGDGTGSGPDSDQDAGSEAGAGSGKKTDDGAASSVDVEAQDAEASAEVGAPSSGGPSAGEDAPADGDAHADTDAHGLDGGRVFASPLARKMAVERGLDPADIKGTGPGGRVVRADVLAAGEHASGEDTSGEHAAAASRDGKAPSSSSKSVPAPASAPAAQQDSLEIPLTQMRKVVAKRLTESAAVPHFFLTAVVQMDALLEFRAGINKRFADSGVKASVTDLLVRACAVALRAHPVVNSSWAGDKIYQHRHVNVGLAVAVPDGLIVPVVRDADRKGLAEIATEARDLAGKAREGTLSLQEFSGGTFTVSNLGMFGIDNFTAIINPPEAAILAVGAAADEPVVRDGELTTRKVLKLTLTVDHRVLDGATAAAFLQDLKQILEDPMRIVL